MMSVIPISRCWLPLISCDTSLRQLKPIRPPVVFYCKPDIASHSPALSAEAYGSVPSGRDGSRLRELCVQILEGDSAANCKPVCHLVSNARVYIDGNEVAVEGLIASNPVVFVICFKPVGRCDRKCSKEVLGELVHEVKVWNVRSDAGISAV